ncbi:MAG: 2-dehydro-3-deoxyphosphooctonate aldolase [Candidatus Poribacteria bacterium]|nr:MAG: 2-dehydro-3-deoxyphosphooctonate aldolase [Candidatus Poribacteria bacterium]
MLPEWVPAQRAAAWGELLIVAGPCALEPLDLSLRIGERLARACERFGLRYCFKGSYDKANRSRLNAPRGLGLQEGLRTLEEVRRRLGVPVLTDIHSPEEARQAAEVVDILQVPALLSRQTDLLLAAAWTGKPVNLKKGQFMAPWDVRHAVEKITSAGNDQVLITDRGVCFGYAQLLIDFAGLAVQRRLGFPLLLDLTHGLGTIYTQLGGVPRVELIADLARAAVALGVNGLFLEAHPEPERAPCDGALMLPLEDVEMILEAAAGALERRPKGTPAQGGSAFG